MEFEHKGTKINFCGGGEFSAEIGGERVKKKSLDAIKKAIDAAEKNAFVPFEALIFDRKPTTLADVVSRVKVIGVYKNPRRRYLPPAFIIDGKQYNEERVGPVSSESHMKSLLAFRAESERIEEERSKQEEELEAKIKWIDTKTYQPKKRGEANG